MSEAYFGPSDYADDDTPYEDSANMPLEPYEDEGTLLESSTDHLGDMLNTNQDAPYTTILLSLHNYLEDVVGLDTIEASTMLACMQEAGSLPTVDFYEGDPNRALTQLKIGLYTDIVPLYANLHDIDQFRRWFPVIMEDVILENHDAAGCRLEDDDYGSIQCSRGVCPAKIICLDVEQNLRRPDCQSFEYQYLPVQTALAWVAKLDYLIDEDYFTDYEGGRLYDQYSRRLKKGLDGFDLNKPDNWF